MVASDFSWFALFTAGLATVAQAYTQPKGDTPSGNSIIKPGLNEVVPAGKPYTVTWDPTTPQDTVTLLLLHGPSENIKVLYPIVEKIPNNGKYEWTPKTDLAPEATHYGIQLIDDKTGAYQYTTQFGISNPSYNPSYGGGSASASASGSASASASASVSATGDEGNTTSTLSVYHASSSLKPSYVASTGLPAGNSTVKPTGSMTVPHSLTSKPTKHTSTLIETTTPSTTASESSSSSPSTTEAPVETGAASAYSAAAGLVGLAAAAVFVL